MTDYDPAAKCFRMTPAVYNDEFAAMAIGYVNSAPNILMWLVFTPSGSFLYRSDQGAIPLVNALVQKAVTLQGSYSHNWPIWEKVIGLLASGRLNLDLVLNRVSPLTEWQQAFEEMHAGKIVKGVLEP